MKAACLAAAILAAASTLGAAEAGAQTQPGAAPRAPLVIGHRGAAGYRPDHTLASYDLAIEMGADFIEPDLVATKDGVLVARHENDISGTTDVAEKFPDRRRKKTIDGQEIDGFFTEDFTLAEIRTLRARQPLPFRSKEHDARYEVPTFAEVIALAKKRSSETGRTIGIYPEIKHPTYFRAIGLPLEPMLIRALRDAGLTTRQSPVIVQCFEIDPLKTIRKELDVRLVQLTDEFDARPADQVALGNPVTYRDMLTAEGLKEIATYADGVGPWKRTIVEENADKTLKRANDVVKDAHAAGLIVHPYTFRSEERYLAPEYGKNPVAEYHAFFDLGIDGVFSDYPDDAVKAVKSWRK